MQEAFTLQQLIVRVMYFPRDTFTSDNVTWNDRIRKARFTPAEDTVRIENRSTRGKGVGER